MAPVARTGGDANPLYAWLEALEREKLLQERRRLLYVAATRAERWLHLFGSARVLDDDEPPERARGRQRSSALGLLWPVVGPAFVERLADARPSRGRGGAGAGATHPPLRRLPTDWRARGAAAAPRIESQPCARAAADADGGVRLGDRDGAPRRHRRAPRAAAHRRVTRACRRRPTRRVRRRWHDELAELGVPRGLRAAAVERVASAVRAHARRTTAAAGCSTRAPRVGDASWRSPGASAARSCGW